METRKLSELKTHPLLDELPMLPAEHPQMVALVDSMRLHGFWEAEPLVAIRDAEATYIVDGRHRKLAAELAGILDAPVVLVPQDDAEGVALGSLIARRHMSKELMAYMAYPILAGMAKSGKLRTHLNLKIGTKKPEKANVCRKSHVATIGNGDLETYCGMMGIDRDTYYRAREIRQAFAEHPALRERYEMKMVCGEIPPSGVRKAIGSLLGNIREGDDLKSKRAERQRHIKSHWEKMQSHFEFWDELGKDRQEEVTESIVVGVHKWPAELQRAVFEELKASLGKR